MWHVHELYAGSAGHVIIQIIMVGPNRLPAPLYEVCFSHFVIWNVHFIQVQSELNDEDCVTLGNDWLMHLMLPDPSELFGS